MLRKILKMFFVRLLFLSILLYYTEAGGIYDPYYVDKVDDSVPVETEEVPTPEPLDRDTERGNLTVTDEKSTTRNRPYYSNQTKISEDSTNETTTIGTYEATTRRRPYHSYWGYGFDNTNGTSATYTKTINNIKPSDWDNESERNESTTTRRSYYSYWGNGFENSNDTAVPSEITYVSSGTIDSKKLYDWNNEDNNKRERIETTTIRRPYHSDWDNKLEIETPAVYDNRYNKTTDGNEKPASDDPDGYGYLTLENRHFPKAVKKTTTTERPYIPGWYNWGRRPGAYYTTSTTENYDTTTTERPYIPAWQTWERRPGDYYTTSTTTTERPYIPDWQTWERRPGAYYTTSTTTTERPYIPNWGNWEQRPEAYYTTSTTENSDTTTTERPYFPNGNYLNRRPEAYCTTTTEDSPYSYYTTSATESPDTTTTTTTTRRPYVICPRGRNSIVLPRQPTNTDGPVQISINSLGNTNGTGIADFLKKLTGAMLPSASNIAPNSNITNLSVANGNGNMFFYVYN